MKDYELVITVIDRGFAEQVMDVAREHGATGGTILNARGTVSANAQTILGISIQPEKDMLLILVDKEIRNDVMKGICDSFGLKTQGKGIVFSLPVDSILGIS